jgi:hypothetical protein
MADELAQLRKTYEKNTNDSKIAEEYCILLTDTIIELSREEKVEEVEKLLEELQSIAKQYPKNNIIAKNFGQTILNVLSIFIGHKPVNDIKSYINNLRSIVYENDSEIMREIMAMTLVNAIYDFSLLRHIPSIHEFALELTDFARKYPDNRKVQIACAKGMMNATIYFLQKGEEDIARDYFLKLMKVVEKYPKEDLVDSRQLIELRKHFNYQ